MLMVRRKAIRNRLVLAAAVVATCQTIFQHTLANLITQGLPHNLPSGFSGTAVVTQTGGPANSLVVTVNMQNSSVFYTYSEPARLSDSNLIC